jgi:hypothetical protein
MLDIGPKLFEYEAPSHDTLRFTQCGCVDQILVVGPYVNWIAEKNSTELFKAFYYSEKFLLGCSVVALGF